MITKENTLFLHKLKMKTLKYRKIYAKYFYY